MTPTADASPVVFASVGTDRHPFDRLVRWIDHIAAGNTRLQCVIQYGTSSAPTVAAGVDYLDHDRLLGWIERASVVITHGGPASIVQVREAHGRPIVVPRDPRRGEHVDGHQVDFATMLHRTGAVDIASSPDELTALVERHLRSEPVPTSVLTGAPVGIGRFAQEVNAVLSRQQQRRSRR